jgi:hypothetical protein
VISSNKCRCPKCWLRCWQVTKVKFATQYIVLALWTRRMKLKPVCHEHMLRSP